MTTGQYVAGVAVAALMAVSLTYGAFAARSRLLPHWSGASARIAEVTIAIALVVSAAQALGSIGALRAEPMAAVAVAVGVVGMLLRSHRRRAPIQRVPGVRASLPRASVAFIGVAVIAVPWLARTFISLDHGMSNEDTLWYHMPFAAEFVQTGSITGLVFTHWDPLPTFYPANSSLVHAVAILPFGTDLLSPMLNLGWFALALLAAWCVGRGESAGPEAMLGAGLVLGAFVMVWTQPGEAMNDVVTLSLFLAAVALLLESDWDKGGVALAGAAAGLALGTKLTILAPVGALTVGVFAVAPRGRRSAIAAAWLVPLIALGGFWYVRNVVHTGNPVPQLDIALGPLELPRADVPTPAEGSRLTVAHYLTDVEVWRRWFGPGLRRAFGPAWFAILLLSAAGMLLSLTAGRTPLHRMLGAVGVVSVAAYVVTPQSAGGAEGSPGLFYFNLRFVTPALVLGLVLLPLVPSVARISRYPVVLIAYSLLLALTLAHSGTWPPARTAVALATVAAAAIAAGVARVAVRRAGRATWRSRRRVAVTAVLVAIAAAAVGWPLQRHYQRGRYLAFGETHIRAFGSPEFVSTDRLDSTFNWARRVRAARIGIAGFYLRYPLYGLDLSNQVEYVGRRPSSGSFSLPKGCGEWREAIARGRYTHVVVTPRGFPYKGGRREAQAVRWIRSGGAASTVLRDHGGSVTVLRIKRAPDAGDC